MSKKQFKVKIEKGNIIPLEPIDKSASGEAVVIFLENFLNEDKDILKLVANDPSNSDLFSNEEDIYSLDDGKPLND